MSRSRDLALLYEKLAQLTRAAVPLKEALALATAGVHDPALRAALRNVRGRVDKGASLTEAFGNEPVFSPLELALLGVGEMNGRLDLRLDDLAELQATRDRQLRQLRGALAYPLFLLAISLLLNPVLTGFRDGLGAYLRAVFSSLLTFAAPVALLALLARLGAGRPRLLDRALLLAPVLGRIAQRRALARFCRALSALLAGGVELRAALTLAVRTLGNRHLVEACGAVFGPLQRGATLGEALAAAGVFPEELLGRVAVAERAGELDRTLLHAAEGFEFEADERQRAVLAALPLVLYLLMGVWVGRSVLRSYTEHQQSIDQLINGTELTLPELPM